VLRVCAISSDLEQLGTQHVRIQINAGHGGCYTMHTDQGSVGGSHGQILHVTALFYLNPDWQVN
jgi:Rps23 Pro-64 3,4-dihydroxylase Tpa1-like proline 4-hydroxylase